MTSSDPAEELAVRRVIVAGWAALDSQDSVVPHVPDAQRLDPHADVGVRSAFSAHGGSDGWRVSEVRLETLWTAGKSLSGGPES